MTRELAKYIEAQPHEIGVRAWLHLYVMSAGNGSVMVNFRELATLYQETIPFIKKALDYRTAAKRELININAETENSVVISFRLPGRPVTKEATKRQLEKVVPTPKNVKVLKKQDVVLPMLIQNDLPDLSAQQPDINTVWSETYKRTLIDDYNQFYKALQANKAINVGVPLEKINPVNPLTTGRDIHILKELTKYFMEQGAKTPEHCRVLFLKIYNSWDRLDEWLYDIGYKV